MALYRIGTAARLSGLEAATLRNWEQRYGVVATNRGSASHKHANEQRTLAPTSRSGAAFVRMPRDAAA